MAICGERLVLKIRFPQLLLCVKVDSSVLQEMPSPVQMANGATIDLGQLMVMHAQLAITAFKKQIQTLLSCQGQHTKV